MHKQMNMMCNSRADNTTAFRQVQKIPEENQLSSDFQIFHKNQIKSSARSIVLILKYLQIYEIQKVFFLLKPKQGLLFSGSKEKGQYKSPVWTGTYPSVKT